jgi:hypothetical protein
MIGLIVDSVKTVFGWLTEKSKAKHERTMAQLELEKRLLLETTKANSDWEIAQLNDKDKILRWASFLLFASPLLASFINPSWGERVQHAWHMLPDWQSNVLSGICLAVFGMRKVPQILGATINAIVKPIREKIPEPEDSNKV